VCCVCQEHPWASLHHFGDDGGKGMKPSDNEVARVCITCHGKWDFKRRALIKSCEPRALDVLESFQNDALKLNRAYAEHLESTRSGRLPAKRCSTCDYCESPKICRAALPHVEPPTDCVMEELNTALAEGLPADPMKAREWIIGWANRRSANAFAHLVDGLRHVASEEHVPHFARMHAQQVLETAGIEEVNDGKDEDRMVR